MLADVIAVLDAGQHFAFSCDAVHRRRDAHDAVSSAVVTRADYRTQHQDLQRALAALAELQAGPYLLARLAELGDLLLDEVTPIGSALKSVLEARVCDRASIEARCRDGAKEYLIPLFETVSTSIVGVEASLRASAHADAAARLSALRAANAKTIGSGFTVASALVAGTTGALYVRCNAHTTRALTTRIRNELRDQVVEPLKTMGLNDSACLALNDGTFELARLATEMSKNAEALNDLYEAYEFGSIVEKLRHLRDYTRATISGDSPIDLVGESPFDGPADLIPNIRLLVSTILDRLSLSPMRSYALDRARAYFEHFFAVDLLERLRQLPGKPEDVLQDELERFLFAEGFFPIVHCEASGGTLDMVIEDCRSSKEHAQSPLLVELKQLIDLGASGGRSSNLQTAVEEAHVQAERYKSTVVANFRWHDAEPYVVVFHNADPTGLNLPPRTCLINLDERSPSIAARRARRANRETTGVNLPPKRNATPKPRRRRV